MTTGPVNGIQALFDVLDCVDSDLLWKIHAVPNDRHGRNTLDGAAIHHDSLEAGRRCSLMTKTKKAERPKRVTKSTLKERGWTETLIKKFLPTPDDTAPNPHYRSAGAAMQLFNLDRVEGIEASAEFKEAMTERLNRQPVAKKAIETKTRRTQEWASSLPEPELPALTKDELMRRAVDHYNARGGSRPDFVIAREERNGNVYCWQPASVNSSADFLDRISVNYVRHVLTTYENRLLAAKGRVGAKEAKEAVRSKILGAIAVAYPWLSEECGLQKALWEVRRDTFSYMDAD
jgi:hypothetical protein